MGDAADDRSRRFTDREVALILKRATDMDEAETPPVGGGLSLEDLRSIAREVGISPSAIDRAVSSLDRVGGMSRSWAGAPRVRKAVRAIPAELTGEDTARLMSLVDDRVDTTGAITEALGSARWTGRDRFKSTRVSITADDPRLDRDPRALRGGGPRSRAGRLGAGFRGD